MAVVQACPGRRGARYRPAGPTLGGHNARLRGGRTAVVPGGPDHQPARVLVAGLGDVAAMALLAR